MGVGGGCTYLRSFSDGLCQQLQYAFFDDFNETLPYYTV